MNCCSYELHPSQHFEDDNHSIELVWKQGMEIENIRYQIYIQMVLF